MCGRYSIVADLFQLQTFFSIDEAEPWPAVPSHPEWKARWNGAPTQTFPVIVAGKSAGPGQAVARKLRWMRWGLIPGWAKDEDAIALGSRMINARVESVTEKPSFKRAVASRRCVVPMSSFFEWHVDDQGVKSPHRIHARGGELLAAAGIWEEWKRHGSNPELPERLTTFSMLTRDANEFMKGIHHRMPVLLDPAKIHEWLDSSGRSAVEVVGRLPLAEQGVPELAEDRVSKLVNSPRNDIPEIWKPEE